jgi:hypothetical protein
VFRAAVFTRWQLSCPTNATLSNKLLPQQGGAILFWVLPLVSWDPLRDPPLTPYWEADLSPLPYSQPLCLASPLLSASLALLGGWLVVPPRFQSLLLFPPLFTESSAPCPILIHQDRFSIVPSPPCPVGVRLQLTVYTFQVFFFWWGIQSIQGMHRIMFLGREGSCAWCMLLTCSFCRFMQAA